MEPIAEYAEKTFRTKKVLTLFPDKIKITGKVLLDREFDVEIELKNVSPVYQRIWQREKTFWGGVAISLLAAAALEILRTVWELPWSHPTSGLMAVFIMSGVLLCCATARKVEYYLFTNAAGASLFDVARAGKRKSEFDGFISQLVATINSLRQSE